MITESEMLIQLVKFIEVETTWESYGYYGPLAYTSSLLLEIKRLAKERGIKLFIPKQDGDA